MDDRKFGQTYKYARLIGMEPDQLLIGNSQQFPFGLATVPVYRISTIGACSDLKNIRPLRTDFTKSRYFRLDVVFKSA